MSYMLDTNICIYAIRNRLGTFWHALRTICITDFVFPPSLWRNWNVESRKAHFRKGMLLALIRFLSILSVLPFNDLAAVEYGRICAALQRQRTPIGTMDMLIATHARSEGLVLVTNNVREFERVPDLVVENWVTA